jgi:hypothetical protein
MAMKQNGHRRAQPRKGKALKTMVIDEKADPKKQTMPPIKRRPRLPVFSGEAGHSEGE